MRGQRASTVSNPQISPRCVTPPKTRGRRARCRLPHRAARVRGCRRCGGGASKNPSARALPRPALALHLAHRAQDTIGAAVVCAIFVAQRDDLRAACLSRVHIVEARQIVIALARDRVGRLEHMRAGAIDNGGVTVQKDRAVERIGVTRAVDVHDALARRAPSPRPRGA